jgi:site-specific DNA-methyltransferase (adenine-specific)
MEDIPDNSIDAIIADLPYGTTRCKWDSVIDLDSLWNHFKRIAKPTTPIVLFAQTPFDKVLGCSNLEWLKYEWIWEKTNATGHLNVKKAPMKAHENILVFYDKQPTYNPQKTSGHARKVSKVRHRVDCKENQVYNLDLARADYDSTERYPRDVIKFSSDKQKQSLHPTQKPLELLEYLVKTYTNEGNVVLDCTMGSGTTGVACVNLSRSFIGIEKDENYYQIACDRISSAEAYLQRAA